jgi:hypothetical protein
MRITRLTLTVAALLALVAATGCKNSSDGGGSAAPPAAVGQDKAGAAKDPCGLVTTTELATLVSTVDKLGAAPPVTQTKQAGEFQGRSCEWTYPRAEAVTDTAEISVTAWHGLQYYTPDVTGGFTAVPGIGDAAHVAASMFMFRKGDEVFLVTVLGDANREELRPAIAKLIVSKL